MQSKKNSKQIAVFIPAMANCHKIQRKFLRILNGKPLLFYSIELALQITSRTNIVLYNDDEEIDILAKRKGVASMFIEESANFPRQFGTNGSVSNLLEMESGNGYKYDYVIWLGPSSPLLRKRDLEDALDFLIFNDIDAVFSASEESQKGWLYNTTYQPRFLEIDNDFRTGVMHKETGAFFIMRRTAISDDGYVGVSAHPFYLQESHSLEINSFNDWWVAEKLLKMKQILFVVSGSEELGMGHVFRALVLAQELNDHEVQFLCTAGSKLAVDYITNYLYPVYIQNENENLIDSVLNLSPDVVINDILDTDEKYVKSLKTKGIMVINFEDVGSGSVYADLVINALYEKKISPNMLVGHKYFCLREEFMNIAESNLNKKVNTILLTFGGTDSNNLTLRILKILVEIMVGYEFQVFVLSGYGYKYKNELKDYHDTLPKQIQKRVKLVNGTKKISEYMISSDIAITSAGRTVYELTALKVPSIIIPANERELMHQFGKKNKMIYMKLHSKLNDLNIKKTIIRLINSFETRKKIYNNLKKYNLTNGKQNIINKINQIA